MIAQIFVAFSEKLNFILGMKCKTGMQNISLCVCIFIGSFCCQKKGRFDGCIYLVLRQAARRATSEFMYAKKSGDKCHNNVGIVDIRKKFSYLFRAGKKSLAAGD